MTAVRVVTGGVLLMCAILATVLMMVFPEAWAPLGGLAGVLLIMGAAILPGRSER